MTEKSAREKAIDRFRSKSRTAYSIEKIVEGVFKGNANFLSKAITLVESSNPTHHEKAQQIIEKCLPKSGNSIRLGITGVPGVGKSTFIEAFGGYLTSKGYKVAVLAIDPSSSMSRGSILGDKTRMNELSKNDRAFIRPSPSSGALGGVANATRESIILCESAGYDVIIVETVGVGQSEITVHGMVDFFLLLMLSGAGDELQGIKRGIMEMADSIVINKADGDNIQPSKNAKREYQNALHLFPQKRSMWSPKVKTCSSTEGTNLDKIWALIEKYKEQTMKNGYFGQNRTRQAKNWMHENINIMLRNRFYQNQLIENEIPHYESKIANKELNPYKAAKELIELFDKSTKNET